MAFNLDISEEQRAKAWYERATELNNRAKAEMDQAQQALKELPNCATGKFLNEVVSLGDQVIDGMSSIMEGMSALCDVVTKVIENAKQVIGELVTGAGNVIKNIMGH